MANVAGALGLALVVDGAIALLDVATCVAATVLGITLRRGSLRAAILVLPTVAWLAFATAITAGALVRAAHTISSENIDMFRLPFSLAFCVGVCVSLSPATRAAELAETVPSPTPRPSVSASAAPNVPYDRFVGVDLLLAPNIADAFAPHVTGSVTQDLRTALEYRFLGRNFVEFEYRRFRYAHPANDPAVNRGAACPAATGDPGCVAELGGRSSVYVRAERLTEQQFELHTSLVGRGHVYVATSTFGHVGNNGYPRLRGDFGFGAELLPALDRSFSLSAAYFYYPEVRGSFSQAGDPSARLRYKLQTFDLRAQAAVPESPLFLEVGFYGDRYLRKENAPSDATHRAFDLGFGVRL